MWFSRIEYSEGVKIHALTKTFEKLLIFDQKVLKIGRFIEENLFFRMVYTLWICLGLLLQVKIVLRHIDPGQYTSSYTLSSKNQNLMSITVSWNWLEIIDIRESRKSSIFRIIEGFRIKLKNLISAVQLLISYVLIPLAIMVQLINFLD